MTLPKKHKHWFARLSLNIRNRLISGIFVIVPFVVTIVVVTWLFGVLKQILEPVVDKASVFLKDYHVLSEIGEDLTKKILYFITFLCLITLIYIIGVIAKFVAGRKLLSIGESLVMRIPLARTIYSATKQVTTAISIQDNQSFTSVVLVEFPRKGAYAFGFLTGTIKDTASKVYCKVFIPTAPNPTTGFFEMIPIDEVVQTELTIEEAFKTIISGGIVAPEILKTSNSLKLIQNKTE